MTNKKSKTFARQRHGLDTALTMMFYFDAIGENEKAERRRQEATEWAEALLETLDNFQPERP